MKKEKKKSSVREYTEGLLVALLIAFVIRSFIVEAFRIPSDSMVTTLMKGDHLFVNKFSYGVRVPWTKKWIFKRDLPKRGDVIVFIAPNDGRDFIKRVIGLPGDKIKIVNDQITVNGQAIQRMPIRAIGQSPQDPKKLLMDLPENIEGIDHLKEIPYYCCKENETDVNEYHVDWDKFDYYLENVFGTYHIIQECRTDIIVLGCEHRFTNEERVVPEGHLFVMGDNRDHSSDSRDWGYVPVENLKGEAMFVWLSWDYDQGWLRTARFGHAIR